MSLRVRVKLWVKDAKFVEFRRFESAAFLIMARHGGKVLSVDRNDKPARDAPDDIHVLEFPDNAAFEAYRGDPELVAMGDLRDACIAKTEVVLS